MSSDQNAPDRVVATVTIAMTNSGQIKVDGPIHNKLLCYGMLKMAEEAVRDFHAAQRAAQNLVQIPKLANNLKV
jgi:hypothetical protein